MRILHFSDIHIGIKLHRVPVSRWLSKRAVGGLNLLLGRQRHFLDARRKIKALVMPHREAVLALTVRVLWVDPSPSPDGHRRAQLALVTPGPAALGRWMEIVEGARV